MDLTKHTGVSLQIEKVGSDPYCEMSVNSKVEKKITVAAGTKASLSFLDCPTEDVRLTASTVIGKMILHVYAFFVFLVTVETFLSHVYHSFLVKEILKV